MTSSLVEAIDVSKVYAGTSGWFSHGKPEFVAVDSCTLKIKAGSTVGLVGSSGSGKSTLSRLLLGLLQPSSGEVRFEGSRVSGIGERALRPMRRKMQIVFQDPLLALNRRKSVVDNIARPLLNFGVRKREAREKALELMESVGINPQHGNRFPAEFSGGQCQRITIARALALDPIFIVLDEPVSALDVSVQAQILNLLSNIQANRQLTYLFVSHDLNLVRHFCEEVAVMNKGRIVDRGAASDIANSSHPFTRNLFLSGAGHP
jgi:peptide/nickel transport system ATP-binding protein/oligopeptide transport system ATP-binding protein